MSESGVRRRKGGERQAEASPTEVPTVPTPPKKSGSDLLMRSIFTILMSWVFLAVQYIGQTPGIILVLACQVLMFNEIMRINRKKNMESQLPHFSKMPWYFLIVVNFFLLSRTLHLPLVNTWPFLEKYLQHSSFLAFCLYIIGFMGFVLSLKPTLPGYKLVLAGARELGGRLRGKRRRGGATPVDSCAETTEDDNSPAPESTPAKPPKQYFFRYQFSQFGWMHMTLLTISVLSSFFLSNMMEGMIWFTLPVSCVIHNDSWAYACGKLFGRTKLVPTLSPKKTWEGFLGAWFFTTLWAVWFSGFLASQKRFVCPKVHFLQPIACDVADIFLPRPYPLPDPLAEWYGSSTITLRPVQLHSIVFAAFASLVAPFGGFFASGMKRAFNLKDFGDLIPGHGGMVDRMDCQLLMALFAFCYISNFVLERGGICNASNFFDFCAPRMETKDQVRLYNLLHDQLVMSGVSITDGRAVP